MFVNVSYVCEGKSKFYSFFVSIVNFGDFC